MGNTSKREATRERWASTNPFQGTASETLKRKLALGVLRPSGAVQERLEPACRSDASPVSKRVR